MSKVEREPKKRSFLSFLFDGLKSVDNKLGDRSQYIGASDIGGCLKRAFLSKTTETKEESALEQLIVLQRGHIAEGIVESALRSKGLNYKSQVEVVGANELSFIKAHIDFVVESAKELVIVECKSIASSIEAPYDSWILQVQLQMGLLKEANPTKPIRAVISAINVANGSVQEFAIDRSEIFYFAAIARAKQLWEAVKLRDALASRAKSVWEEMKERIEPKGECGALCAYCPFKGQCQTLRASASELPADIAVKLARLKALNAQEKEIKSLASEIKSYLESANLKKAISGSNTVALVNCKGKPSVNLEKLKELVGEDVIAECVSEGDSYSYLRVA